MHNLNLKLKSSKLDEFIEVLKDVSNIDPIIKIKMEQENTLLYSMNMNGTITTSMKTTIINTNDFFEIDDVENSKSNSYNNMTSIDLDIVIYDAIKLLKQLVFFDSDSDIKMNIIYASVSHENTSVNHVRIINFIGKSNKKVFKVNVVCGELRIIKTINKEFISTRLDKDLAEWEFDMNAEDISDIKRLSAINSKLEKAIQLKIDNGNVSFSEIGMWDIDVSTMSDKTIDTSILFSKKYLSVINTKVGIINFSKFPTFILVMMDDSKLIMSYEEDFE